MSVDDDDGVARLPTRAAPGGTRTDTRLTPREATSITKPLLTADESAEDDASDVDDDEADLFEDKATVAEVPALPAATDATRISALRNAHDVARDDRSDDADDDDGDDDDGDDDGAERTVVSMVVPQHLLDSPSLAELPATQVGDGLFDADDFVDGRDDAGVAEPFVPKATEVVTTRLPARPTSTARPGWVLGLLVFGGVVGAALIVILIVALVR